MGGEVIGSGEEIIWKSERPVPGGGRPKGRQTKGLQVAWQPLQSKAGLASWEVWLKEPSKSCGPAPGNKTNKVPPPGDLSLEAGLGRPSVLMPRALARAKSSLLAHSPTFMPLFSKTSHWAAT